MQDVLALWIPHAPSGCSVPLPPPFDTHHQPLLQCAQVLVHLPEQQLQFAARHVQLLLGLAVVPGLLPDLQLRPQGVKGSLAAQPALQLLPQILQESEIRTTPYRKNKHDLA